MELVDYTCCCSFAFKEPAALVGRGCQDIGLADDRVTAQAEAMAAHAPWWVDHWALAVRPSLNGGWEMSEVE
ncbi:hypothetical protein O0J72_07935 [Stenotrophomonas sp. Sm3212]|uniref:hypothetical protein n=1 Tax=Stenotrophomonas sp. Sm3212 TaxID=3002748 RepID=UPI0027E5A707|nr:hypothetical protein [Stenotrophomonas sp. Sm3212]MDQ7272055.1 hypothetical protein [Stenotrophomonas sp. Sm3212]